MLLRLYFYARKRKKSWCTFVRFMLLRETNKRWGQRDLNKKFQAHESGTMRPLTKNRLCYNICIDKLRGGEI